MNHADSVIRNLTEKLKKAGFCAFSDFEHCEQPVPQHACYLSVGDIQSRCSEALFYQQTILLPLTCTIRIRLHFPHKQTGINHDAYRYRLLRVLLSEKELCISNLRFTGCRYHPRTDRLITDCLFDVDAIMKIPEKEDGNVT